MPEKGWYFAAIIVVLVGCLLFVDFTMPEWKVVAANFAPDETTWIPYWDNKTVIMFLHIGKSGGTSFDVAVENWLQKNSLSRHLYYGRRHFDFSGRGRKFPLQNAKVIFEMFKTWPGRSYWKFQWNWSFNSSRSCRSGDFALQIHAEVKIHQKRQKVSKL